MRLSATRADRLVYMSQQHFQKLASLAIRAEGAQQMGRLAVQHELAETELEKEAMEKEALLGILQAGKAGLQALKTGFKAGKAGASGTRSLVGGLKSTAAGVKSGLKSGATAAKGSHQQFRQQASLLRQGGRSRVGALRGAEQRVANFAPGNYAPGSTGGSAATGGTGKAFAKGSTPAPAASSGPAPQAAAGQAAAGSAPAQGAGGAYRAPAGRAIPPTIPDTPVSAPPISAPKPIPQTMAEPVGQLAHAQTLPGAGQLAGGPPPPMAGTQFTGPPSAMTQFTGPSAAMPKALGPPTLMQAPPVPKGAGQLAAAAPAPAPAARAGAGQLAGAQAPAPSMAAAPSVSANPMQANMETAQRLAQLKGTSPADELAGLLGADEGLAAAAGGKSMATGVATPKGATTGRVTGGRDAGTVVTGAPEGMPAPKPKAKAKKPTLEEKLEQARAAGAQEELKYSPEMMEMYGLDPATMAAGEKAVRARDVVGEVAGQGAGAVGDKAKAFPWGKALLGAGLVGGGLGVGGAALGAGQFASTSIQNSQLPYAYGRGAPMPGRYAQQM